MGAEDNARYGSQKFMPGAPEESASMGAGLDGQRFDRIQTEGSAANDAMENAQGEHGVVEERALDTELTHDPEEGSRGEA